MASNNDETMGISSNKNGTGATSEKKIASDLGKGKEVIKSFEGFLSFVIGISIFGASTFSIIVSEIADPSEISAAPRFTQETVRTFLALGWLFFVLALGLGGVGMSVLAFQREHAKSGIDSNQKEWVSLGLLMSSAIQFLIIGAFFFLALVLVAYSEVVGWISVAFTAFGVLLVIVSLGIQWIRLLKKSP